MFRTFTTPSGVIDLEEQRVKKTLAVLTITVLAASALWIATAPPSYYEPAGLRVLGAPPEALLRADVGDVIKTQLVTIAPEIPGNDENLVLPGTGNVLVSGRDEWIWQVNVESQTAEKIAYAPVSPTGTRPVPGKPDQVYFCMARLDFHTYENPPGVYRLDLKTRTFTPVVTQVPLTGHMREDGLEQPNFTQVDEERVYPEPLMNTPVARLDANNSRTLQFCNDLDVTPDGRYIYITEPFSHPKASSGLGAFGDGITLARNGRIWRYDTHTRSIGLVVENIVFADGILIEYDEQAQPTSLLISETVNFRIGRAYLQGERAGGYEVLWDDLPGLPDGIDRDDQGRIWIGLIKDRTPLITWMHRNPWVKPLILRIPPQWLPASRGTAILGLSPDASEIIAYSHHDGSRILDISVVAPAGDRLYLPSFHKDNAGLHYLPIDALLGTREDTAP